MMSNYKTSMSMVLLVTSLLLALSLPAQAEERRGQLAHDLSFSLSISIVAICVLIMTIVGIVLLYRAKKGYFCCLKPRIMYPVVRPKRIIRRTAHTTNPEDPATPAPTYEVHPRGADIAPPDYEDALQDMVVQPAEAAHEQTEDDISLDADDQTPLNP